MAEGFEFNKIYVVESLIAERKTGRELFDDLLRWREMQITELSCQIFQPDTKKDFSDNLTTILEDTRANGNCPILHIEAHGDRRGLMLASSEYVAWAEMYEYFAQLNMQSRFNLFLTLGICKGAYLMEEIKSDRPAPFWGFIGSFDDLFNNDIIIRYLEFYTEFLSSYDLNRAYENLLKANPGFTAKYRFVSSEQTFKNVYRKYVETQFSDEAIKRRFDTTNKEIGKKYADRNTRSKDFIQFKSNLFRTKDFFMEKHRDLFFMVELYPENRVRFNLDNWQPFK